MIPRPDPSAGKGPQGVDRLAEAIADGVRVDWDAARAAHPTRQNELRFLEGLAVMRHAFSVNSPSSNQPTLSGEPGEFEMPEKWGHFKIEKKLGRGSYADVFLAHDLRLDTHVALKLLRPDRIEMERERFLDEARRLAQVDHPHVVAVHGVDEHDGRPGLWMHYLAGPNLEERLAQGKLGWKETAMIGIEVCGALAAIHAAGLVHGDIKTSNIVQDEGRNVVTDFGAAEDVEPAADWNKRLCGTLLFMAPEIFLGFSPPSRVGDLYALGVVLYRLVSGSYPLHAKDEADLAKKHRQGKSVRLRDLRPDLPIAFLQVVECAIDPAPSRRFASAGEMERALLAALFPTPGPQPAWTRLLDWWRDFCARRRRQVRLAAIGATVALAGVAVWVVIQSFFNVEASLYRSRGEDLPLEELTSGAEIHPGDRICLRFRGSHDAYVYVLNDTARDPQNVNCLFPVRGLNPTNPVRKRTRNYIPRTLSDKQTYWKIDAEGGKERFLIVASRSPVRDIEKQIETVWRGAAPEVIPGPLELIMSRLGPPSRGRRWTLVEVECRIGGGSVQPVGPASESEIQGSLSAEW